MSDYVITPAEINKIINTVLTRTVIKEKIESVSFWVLYFNSVGSYCNESDEGAIKVFSPFKKDPNKPVLPLIVAAKKLVYDEIKKLGMTIAIDAATTYQFSSAVLTRFKTALPEYNWDEANPPEDLISLKYDPSTKAFFKQRVYYPVLTVSTKGAERKTILISRT